MDTCQRGHILAAIPRFRRLAEGPVPALDTFAERFSLRGNMALLTAAEVLLVAVQLPFLHTPLSQDESVYYTVAEHGLPYVATFDQKPPLIYAWYKAALLLNGGTASPVAIHLLALGVLAVTAVLVFLLGKILVNGRFGAVAAVTFAALVGNPHVLDAANTETFALPWLLLSMLAFIHARRTGSVRWLAASGAFGGLAILTKTTLIFPVAIPAILLISPGHIDASLKRMGAMASGAVLVLAAGVLPWLLTGHFAQFWYANVTFNLGYSAAVSLSQRPVLIALGSLGASLGSLVVVVAVIAGIRLRRRIIPGDAYALLWLWLAGALLAVIVTGPVLPYYFVALFPAAALLSAATLIEIASRWSEWPIRRLAYLTLAPALGLTLGALIPMYAASPSPEKAYAQKFPHDSGLLASEMSGELSDSSRPGDELLVIGNGMQLYALSGLTPPTHVFATPLLGFDHSLLSKTVKDADRAQPRFLVEIVGDSPSSEDREITDAFAPMFAHYHLVYSTRGHDASGSLWMRVPEAASS